MPAQPPKSPETERREPLDTFPMLLQRDVDNDRAVGLLDAVEQGRASFPVPRPIAEEHVPTGWRQDRGWVPVNEVDIAGYRVSGEAVSLLQRTLQASGEKELDMLRSAIRHSGLEQRSKTQLLGLLARPEGAPRHRLRMLSPERRRDALQETLNTLDWRMERARHHGNFLHLNNPLSAPRDEGKGGPP